jgi:hypothetical protein
MRLITAALAVIAIAGCNNGMDQQSATKVMSSALIGTGQAQAQFKPTNGQTNASFDGTITNPAGSGSAHVTGSAVDNNGTWTVNFDITYTNWTDLAANVTLNGSLHESASFTTMSPLVGSVKITGDVAATGSVQGTADFDLAVDYSPTKYQVSGHVGGASLDASVNL